MIKFTRITKFSELRRIYVKQRVYGYLISGSGIGGNSIRSMGDKLTLTWGRTKNPIMCQLSDMSKIERFIYVWARRKEMNLQIEFYNYLKND